MSAMVKEQKAREREKIAGEHEEQWDLGERATARSQDAK